MDLNERELQLLNQALIARSDALFNKINLFRMKENGPAWKGYWMNELEDLKALQAKLTTYRVSKPKAA